MVGAKTREIAFSSWLISVSRIDILYILKANPLLRRGAQRAWKISTTTMIENKYNNNKMMMMMMLTMEGARAAKLYFYWDGAYLGMSE